MTTKYTLEQFESDMENASPSQMEGFLMKAVDELDIFDPLVKESLQKYRDEFQDIKDQLDIESDYLVQMAIEIGKCELYTCIKEIDGYNTGQNYYVQIDTDFLSKETTDSVAGISDEVAKYINGIKPLAWIVKDKGLGTLKKKHLFGIGRDLNFSEYFEKVSNK